MTAWLPANSKGTFKARSQALASVAQWVVALSHRELWVQSLVQVTASPGVLSSAAEGPASPPSLLSARGPVDGTCCGCSPSLPEKLPPWF